jgi:hypothetical protein
MQGYNNELRHFGKLGMKWRHHKTKRDARNDAHEFARAKMFYGKGAGTRRKLIKAQVESRSKDKIYKEEFDKALSEQDMGKHAEKAKIERLRKDTTESVTKTTKGFMNLSMGNAVRVSSTAAGLYTIARMTGMDKKIADVSKEAMRVGLNFVMDRFNNGVY